LAGLAARVGLQRETFLAALDDPQLDEQVQRDIDRARKVGLNSVPALVFDNRYLISGAQPYAVLVQATEHVQAELAQERV
jgi:predicted DsbA family dithiol-disulfide isomerase